MIMSCIGPAYARGPVFVVIDLYMVVMEPVPYFAGNSLEVGFYIAISTMVNYCAVMLKYQCGTWEKWEIG